MNPLREVGWSVHRLSASDRSTWAPMLAHGDAVGIERKWTETIPTTLPAYVRAAPGE